MIRLARRGAVLFLLAVAGCPSGGVRPDRAAGQLHLLCEPRDATVFLDDRFVGRAGALPGQTLPVPAGVHRLEVRRDGYFSHYVEVRLSAGDRQKLVVKLRKEPF